MSASDTGIFRKNKFPSAHNRSRIYDLAISISDALPLTYRRLVVATTFVIMVEAFPLSALSMLVTRKFERMKKPQH